MNHPSANFWRSRVVLLAIAFAATVSSGMAEDPFAASRSEVSEPIMEPTITIIAEWIEVELDDLHRLTTGKTPLPLGGNEMRKAVAGLIEDKRAEVIHTAMLRTRSGQRGQTEGIDEVIYPTEFDPPDINVTGEAITHALPTSFETRNTGPSLEVDPVLGFDGETVDLRFSAEIVEHLGERTYGKDVAEVEVPDFYKVKVTTLVTGRSGHYRLAGTFRPSGSLGNQKRKDPRLMLFVRTDVKPVNSPSSEDEKKAVIRENWERERTLVYHFDFIETDLATLNSLLVEKRLSTRGPELHDTLIEAIGTGQATLIDTVVAAGRAGDDHQTRVRSGAELIYPTDWDPPVVSADGSIVLPASPAAFQSLDLGLDLTFQSRFDGGDIGLSFDSALVSYVTRRKFMKDQSEVTFPLNHFARLTNQMSLWPNETAFAGTVRPDKPADEGRKNPVIAVFVRGEVVDPFVPPKEAKAKLESE